MLGEVGDFKAYIRNCTKCFSFILCIKVETTLNMATLSLSKKGNEMLN